MTQAEDEVYSVLIHYTIDEAVLNELQAHKKKRSQEDATLVKEESETTSTAKKGTTNPTKKAKANSKVK